MAIKAVITNLPNNGGSAITDLQYRIGTGNAVSFPAATVGTYDTTAVPGDEVSIRAVNAVGPGNWSAAKTIAIGSTELLLNPSFTDTSVWAGTDPTTAFTISGGNLALTNRGPDYTHGVAQTVVLSAIPYTVSVTLVSATGQGMRIKFGFGLDAYDVPEMDLQLTPGTYVATYTPPTAGSVPFILSCGASSTATWSEVSIKPAV